MEASQQKAAEFCIAFHTCSRKGCLTSMSSQVNVRRVLVACCYCSFLPRLKSHTREGWQGLEIATTVVRLPSQANVPKKGLAECRPLAPIAVGVQGILERDKSDSIPLKARAQWPISCRPGLGEVTINSILFVYIPRKSISCKHCTVYNMEITCHQAHERTHSSHSSFRSSINLFSSSAVRPLPTLRSSLPTRTYPPLFELKSRAIEGKRLRQGPNKICVMSCRKIS